MTLRPRITAIAASLIFALTGGAQAQCRLALILALDVSSSVDPGEYQLQKLGLATALNSVPIRDALINGPGGYVSLAVFEWSGRYQQQLLLDWTRMDAAKAIDGVVARIAGAERSYSRFPTAIGYALGYAAGLFRRGPDCKRRVIDVSGDGPSNEGADVSDVRDSLVRGGVQINGLAIETTDDTLTDYYRDRVIGGPGAFVLTAKTFEDYPRAIRRKLLREITKPVVEAPRPRGRDAG